MPACCACRRPVKRVDAVALRAAGRNCAVRRPDAINRFLGFRPAARAAHATPRTPRYLSLGPEINVVDGSGASSNAISGHFEPLSRCNLRALLPLSWPPADPHAGRTPSPQPRAHVPRCPSAAAAPGRHKTALDTRGAVEPRAGAANPQSPRARSRREPPSLSPRAKRGTAPWRPRAAASSRPWSPT